MNAWIDAFDTLQDGLFQQAVAPALQALGLASLMEDGYVATLGLGVALLQLAVMALGFGLLERLWPFERAPADATARRERAQAVRVDWAYTLIDVLGLLRLGLFFALGPLWDTLFGRLAVAGWQGWHLDQALAPWWPGVSDTALAGFLAYLLVLDGAGYLIHRAQHRWGWWWALHAVHHSQRHMTRWSDSRNHLLDAVIVDCLFVLLAKAIGVPPAQFIGLVALSKLLESLAHANTGLRLGWLGERLLVGPRFHRVHHAIGAGHEDARTGRLGGCNYAVLFPFWDALGGSARFDLAPGPTGIRDQLPEAGGRDYGRGFWAQQGLGLQRLAQALRPGRGPAG